MICSHQWGNWTMILKVNQATGWPPNLEPGTKFQPRRRAPAFISVNFRYLEAADLFMRRRSLLTLAKLGMPLLGKT